MARVLPTLGLVVFGLTTAHAAPASAFDGYNSIDVYMSSDASKCGLQDAERYSSYLADSLVAAGVEPDASAPAMAQLGLSAAPFADLGGKCVVIGSLDFMVPLEVSDVEMVVAADKHEAIVAAFEQTEMLPVVLYDSREFTTSEANAGDGAATYLIDTLVKNLPANP